MAAHPILVATDFSETSREAVEQAVVVAAGLNTKLVIAYVAEDNVFNSSYLADKIGTSFLSMTAEQVREAAHNIITIELNTLVHKVKKNGVQCSSTILNGQPAKALSEYATDNACMMIVVGTHGHSNLGHLMFGSTTDRLLRIAGCPVLVVRKNFAPAKSAADSKPASKSRVKRKL